MDRVLHFVLALAVVAILALLVSSDRKKIRIRYVIQLLVIEVLLAWFFLNSDVGLGFVKGFSEMFEKLLGFANEGTNFVFGSMNDQGLAFFFLKVLCPIVFISALIGILQHIRVLPVIIRAIGFLLSKVNGMGKLESFNAVSSLILGQSENFIAIVGPSRVEKSVMMAQLADECGGNYVSFKLLSDDASDDTFDDILKRISNNEETIEYLDDIAYLKDLGRRLAV